MRRQLKVMARVAAAAVVGWLAYVYLVRQPSNQRDWEFGMVDLPKITIDGSIIQVSKIRDYRYAADGAVTTNLLDRALDLNRLERVWFVYEPFTISPFRGFTGVAHTYFVFDFQDQPPLAISVESRREKGEDFDAIRGLFNEYELIYIWGTELDLTGRRAVVEHNRLYMYPLTIPIEAARELLLQLAESSRALETQPRFYNTLTSNCTNELARAANRVLPGAIPLHPALVFPGYSPQLLHELGFIPNDRPMDTLAQTYFITDLVLASYERDDFSQRLRAALAQRERAAPGAR